MLSLALRQILTRKKQTFLILLGIVLGTTAYVVISGIMLGFQQYILDQLVNNTSQISISAREQYITKPLVTKALFKPTTTVVWQTPPSGVRQLDYITNPSGWYHQLDGDKQVVAYVPQLQSNAIAVHGAANESISVIGCDPLKQLQVTSIAKYMQSGQFSHLKNGSYGIVLGADLAKKLGVQVNNTIQLSTTNGRIQAFKVVGTYAFGIKQLDEATAYTALSDLQNTEQKQGVVTDIGVKVKQPEMADKIADNWQQFSRDKVASWQQNNANILSVFAIQTFIRYFMCFSILLVSAFGIYNILNIVINQKKREIAILRTIGYSQWDITWLFLSQGLLLGCIGGLLGCLFGFAACCYLSTLPAVGDAMGPTNHFLVSFESKIYVGGFLLAFVSAAISSIIPARAAGKLTPIQIIRSEIEG